MADNPDSTHLDPLPPSTDWDDLRRELARDVDRVADRLRGLSQARLAAAPRRGPEGEAGPPHGSLADAARAAAQALADASGGIEAGPAPDPPTWRALPGLDDFAVGDQVAVTGHDLLAAAANSAPDAQAWTRDGRRTTREVLVAAAAALAALRHTL